MHKLACTLVRLFYMFTTESSTICTKWMLKLKFPETKMETFLGTTGNDKTATTYYRKINMKGGKHLGCKVFGGKYCGGKKWGGQIWVAKCGLQNGKWQNVESGKL